MVAVAQIFAAQFPEVVGSGKVTISVNVAADPPWSEARIVGASDLTVKARGDPECHYDYGTTDERPDRLAIGIPFGFIAFGLLSDEIETRDPDGISFYTLHVLGLPKAVCGLKTSNPTGVKGKEKVVNICSDRLEIYERSYDSLREIIRAVRYVFNHVCSPAELPLVK